MADRKKQLSLNAALLAVKNYAKFHALSRILLDRGEIPMSIYGNFMWAETPDKINQWNDTNVKRIRGELETWGDEWKEANERLGAANLNPGHIASLSPEPDEFAVLVHGDSWTNNMMFQGEDVENPTSFRLMDFQICFINSPASDLSQLFISSVRLEDQKQNIDVLLQNYTDTLKSYLLKLGYEGRVPTVDDIRRSLQRMAPMTLNDAFGWIPIVMGDADDAVDLEDVMSKLNEGQDAEYSSNSKLTPDCVAIIKHQIRKAMELGII